MINHKIYFISKDSNFMSGNLPDTEFLKFKYISDNKLPLAVIYNKIIEENKDVDFLYLVHSDVKLDFKMLAEHVESVRDKYDVIGLCGCSNISVSQSPLNWFCGSIPFPEKRWGCVSHGELKGQISYFSSHSPDITDHEVACIDGLCIILSQKAIQAGLRFDENLGQYDMYDTDLSFQAVLKYKLKLGVVIRKDLCHYSVGKSILSENFLRTEIKFRNKWNLEIPQNSPIRKLH